MNFKLIRERERDISTKVREGDIHNERNKDLKTKRRENEEKTYSNRMVFFVLKNALKRPS